MEDYLIYLKNSYLIVPVCIIIAIFLMFLDSKLRNNVASKKDYIRVSFIVGIVTIFVVYTNSIKGTLEEEVLGGNPPF